MKITDSTGDMIFYNGFTGGVLKVVTDYFLPDSEREQYILIAREFVPEGLKAPATAQFPEVSDPDWKVARYGTYVDVKSWVDAENTYSALIRNEFFVQIDYTTKEVLYMTIEGDWMFGENQHWLNP